MENEMTDELLTNKEAAKFLRSWQVALWRLRRDGILAFNRFASKILYRRADLENFLTRNRRNGEMQNDQA